MCGAMAALQPVNVVCRNTGGPTEALNFFGTTANSVRSDQSADRAEMALPVRLCRALDNSGHTVYCNYR